MAYFSSIAKGSDEEFESVIGDMYKAANKVQGRTGKLLELFNLWDIDGNGEAGRRELTAYCKCLQSVSNAGEAAEEAEHMMCIMGKRGETGGIIKADCLEYYKGLVDTASDADFNEEVLSLSESILSLSESIPYHNPHCSR